MRLRERDGCGWQRTGKPCGRPMTSSVRLLFDIINSIIPNKMIVFIWNDKIYRIHVMVMKTYGTETWSLCVLRRSESPCGVSSESPFIMTEFLGFRISSYSLQLCPLFSKSSWLLKQCSKNVSESIIQIQSSISSSHKLMASFCLKTVQTSTKSIECHSMH